MRVLDGRENGVVDAAIDLADLVAMDGEFDSVALFPVFLEHACGWADRYVVCRWEHHGLVRMAGTECFHKFNS